MTHGFLILAAGVAAFLLALAGFEPDGQSAPDTVTCTGYPEPRIFLENQSWWEAQPGPVTHPGTGKQGHIHVGACFPMYQTLTGPTLHLDVTVKLHNMPGLPSWLRAQSYGDVSWEKRAPGEHSPAKYIPACPTADCEYVLPWDIDLTKVRYNGWHQFAIFLNIAHTDGALQRNWTRWYARFALPGRPYGVPGGDGQFGTLGSIYSDWVGGDSWYSPIMGGTTGKYAQASIKRTSLPWSEITGKLTPLSGRWTITVRFEARKNFVNIDPALHSMPVRHGQVVYEETTPNRGFYRRVVSIDTTKLRNGLHRLLIGSSNVATNGTHSGVLVVPFLVEND